MENTLILSDDVQITQLDFFVRMLVTVGIGFVIGLEREHASFSKGEEVFAGLRTFVLVALLGFLSGTLATIFSFWIIIAGFLGLSILVSISYGISANRGQLGGTTEIAALLVYLLGALTLVGYVEFCLALTVVIVLFLSLKVKFQSLIGRITQSELFAFIQFVIVVLLIFPFLPDRDFGPYQIINPKEIGWVIVLTSGVGFFGYMLMKFIGSNRGILLTGIVGGLVSSTVVSWVFSKKSKTAPEFSASCTVAIMAASTIMVIRVFVWIVIFNSSLIHNLLLPLLTIFAAALGVTLYYYKKQGPSNDKPADLPLGEPLNLREAIFFGILYTAILLVVSYASDQFGHKGIYLSSALAGLTDIDAITISVAKIAGDSMNIITAQNAIILATLSNTIIKLGISLWAGSGALRKQVLLGYGLMFLAGLIGLLIINL